MCVFMLKLGTHKHFCTYKRTPKVNISFVPQMPSNLIFLRSGGVLIICNSPIKLGSMSSGCLSPCHLQYKDKYVPLNTA